MAAWVVFVVLFFFFPLQFNMISVLMHRKRKQVLERHGEDKSEELSRVLPIRLMLRRWEQTAGFGHGGKRISAAINSAKVAAGLTSPRLTLAAFFNHLRALKTFCLQAPCRNTEAVLGRELLAR